MFAVAWRATIWAAAAGLAGTPAFAQGSAVADFYRGKTVNLIIGTVVGGEYDLHSRLIGRYIGRHIPGSPTIVPQNMLGGGGIVMANYFYAVAPRDGTSLGVINNGYPGAQVMGEAAIHVDNSKLFWIGALSPTSETVAVWHTTGVRTIEEAMKTEVVIGSSGKGSITYTFPKLLNELVGTKFKLVTDYRGGNDINVAMERGEVGGRENTWSSWKSTKRHWLDKGEIRILVQGGETAKDLPGVPNIEDLAKNDEDRAVMRLIFAGSRLGRPVVTTPGVPPDRVKALRDAFDATMKDPEFLAAAAQAKVEVDPVPGLTLQKWVDDILKSPPKIAQRAKELLE